MIRTLVRGAADWPAVLDQLGADAPSVLHVRGARPLAALCAEPAVAIVGARRGSRQGEEFAYTLGRGLGAAGVAVISGLALGIDAAAHAGALAAGGRTVAVLGCGIDRVYPRQNAAIAAQIGELGALVSEWGVGVEPAPWRFPVRNRLIAALASVTVVVEATRRSGALITADHALALGRDVLAVPGSAWSPLGEGVNALLRAGATPATSLDDVLDALGLSAPGAVRASALPDATPLIPAGSAGRAWRALRAEPMTPDALALRLGLAGPELARVLVTLELDGLLALEPDGRLVALSGVGAAGTR
ncbi:MAG: DNA-processing protein DprA [Gaiellales bacterium]